MTLITLVALVALLLCAAPEARANLIQNGGFETPLVTDNAGWDIFEEMFGWSFAPADGGVSPPWPELHRGVNGWDPAEGAQHIELDSDELGPGYGNPAGEAGSMKIWQELALGAGQYELTFAYSPRPKTGPVDNVLGVDVFGGQVVFVDESLVADGSGSNQTQWVYHTYSFLLPDPMLVTVQFADEGRDNTLGTFLDDVQLVRADVPEPGTLLLSGAAIVGLAGATRRRRR
jgi:hypothetical protein